MYMQKVGAVSGAVRGGSLATQQSPGRLSGILLRRSAETRALNLAAAEVDLVVRPRVCKSVRDYLSVGG